MRGYYKPSRETEIKEHRRKGIRGTKIRKWQEHRGER